MGVRGKCIVILILLQKPFRQLLLTFMQHYFLKSFLIVNKKVHDPQRPHFDKGYDIEDYNQHHFTATEMISSLSLATSAKQRCGKDTYKPEQWSYNLIHKVDLTACAPILWSLGNTVQVHALP